MNCCPQIIFIDLDGTIWAVLNISTLKPPFLKLKDDVIIDSSNTYVRLFPNVIDFLNWVKRKEMMLFALSWNIYEIAYQALGTFGLTKFFDGLYIEYHPYKDLLMKRALKELKKKLNLNVNPCQIIYVDDRDLHVAAIKRNIGNVLFIKMWHDVKGFNELKIVLENIIRKEC